MASGAALEAPKGGDEGKLKPGGLGDADGSFFTAGAALAGGVGNSCLTVALMDVKLSSSAQPSLAWIK